MRLTFPHCRDHFTGHDLNFIATSLGVDPDNTTFLKEFLCDPELRDRILDSKKLMTQVLETPDCLCISTSLYFYLIVRCALKRKGVEERELADYVAEVLVEQAAPAKRAPALNPESSLNSDYMVDKLAEVCDKHGERLLEMNVHIGDFALLMTGLYPERIEWRHSRRGAPGLDYYEHLGSTGYEKASQQPLAAEFEIQHVLHELSEAFHPVRLALNDMADRIIFIRQHPSPNQLVA